REATARARRYGRRGAALSRPPRAAAPAAVRRGCRKLARLRDPRSVARGQQSARRYQAAGQGADRSFWRVGGGIERRSGGAPISARRRARSRGGRRRNAEGGAPGSASAVGIGIARELGDRLLGQA